MKLIESIAALLVLAIILPLLANLWMQGNRELEKRQAADHLVAVTKATASYIRKNQTTLLTQAGTSSGPIITIAQLISGGFLTTGFSEYNVWRQTYQIYIRQPTSNTLQGIVLTSGGRGQDSRDAQFANSMIERPSRRSC